MLFTVKVVLRGHSWGKDKTDFGPL